MLAPLTFSPVQRRAFRLALFRFRHVIVGAAAALLLAILLALFSPPAQEQTEASVPRYPLSAGHIIKPQDLTRISVPAQTFQKAAGAQKSEELEGRRVLAPLAPGKIVPLAMTSEASGSDLLKSGEVLISLKVPAEEGLSMTPGSSIQLFIPNASTNAPNYADAKEGSKETPATSFPARVLWTQDLEKKNGERRNERLLSLAIKSTFARQASQAIQEERIIALPTQQGDPSQG